MKILSSNLGGRNFTDGEVKQTSIGKCCIILSNESSKANSIYVPDDVVNLARSKQKQGKLILIVGLAVAAITVVGLLLVIPFAIYYDKVHGKTFYLETNDGFLEAIASKEEWKLLSPHLS